MLKIAASPSEILATAQSCMPFSESKTTVIGGLRLALAHPPDAAHIGGNVRRCASPRHAADAADIRSQRFFGAHMGTADAGEIGVHAISGKRIGFQTADPQQAVTRS